MLFDFAADDVRLWYERLIATAGDPLPQRRRSPFGQLLKSMISSRTYDAVSISAYDALVARFPTTAALTQAGVAEVGNVIAPVTFAEDKARNLVAAIARIASERSDLALEFLADLPLDAALAWLERLPGVGRKVSASTLNASILSRPVFIVDTHVLRVLQRLGFVGRAADNRVASEAVTEALAGESGDDFFRLHILMKRLGQQVCRRDEPLCEGCMLTDSCRTGRTVRAAADLLDPV